MAALSARPRVAQICLLAVAAEELGILRKRYNRRRQSGPRSSLTEKRVQGAAPGRPKKRGKGDARITHSNGKTKVSMGMGASRR